MRVGIIANPAAGRPGSMRIVPNVERFAARWASEVRIEEPSNGKRLEAVTADLAAHVELIIVVGGDGTLNGVVNGLPEGSQVAVAFLPAGRGKDSARTLPSLTVDALGRANVRWRTDPVDVGQVATAEGTTRRFINIASFGLGATAARVAARLPRLPGTMSYLIGAGFGLVSDREVELRLRCDGGPERMLPGCRLVAVANGRYFGGGLHIAPMADACDGLLEAVAVCGAGRLEILKNLPRVFRGTHMTHPAVHHATARSLTIATDPHVGIETDGEVIGQTPATITVEPGALRWAVLT